MESKSDKNKNPNAKQALWNQYFSQEDSEFTWVQDSQEAFAELAKLEEILISTIYSQSERVLDTPVSESIQKFQESIDIETAEIRLTEGSKIPLPDYLARYTEANLDKPERKQSLVVRLSQAGIQFFESMKMGLNLEPTLSLSPELRSAVAAHQTSNETGFVVFEEKVQDGQKFYYQLVKETPKEIFMSVKIDSKSPQDFRQVILRKDGRFILSNKINPDGVVSFSGLKEGAYSVEFLGESQNKVVDLYLIVD
jgi:hypothetical protein